MDSMKGMLADKFVRTMESPEQTWVRRPFLPVIGRTEGELIHYSCMCLGTIMNTFSSSDSLYQFFNEKSYQHY